MRIAILAALVILFAVPADAQSHTAMGGGSTAAAYTGGGGGAAGGASGSHAMFHAPVTQFDFGYAHGTTCDFNPSSYMEYDEAVKYGQAVVAAEAKPKTLGEIAAEYRASKKRSS